MTNETEIESPCIGVCSIDDTSGFCVGCYRTVDEIKNWWDKTNTEKSAILVQTEARMSDSFD
jgi:predicted Fe-S protein YdhL (DUF1289 family)